MYKNYTKILRVYFLLAVDADVLPRKNTVARTCFERFMVLLHAVECRRPAGVCAAELKVEAVLNVLCGIA